jgi:PKD repeat protein
MKSRLLLLLFVLLTIPGISAAAELRTLEIEFSFTSPDDPDKQIASYRLYKENVQVCDETADSNTTAITCDILTEDGTFNFTLTGYYSNGTESPHSPSFPFNIDSKSVTFPPVPDPDPLLAVITPTLQSGEVPLNVPFSGANSTGVISTWYWEFGDGTSSTSSATNHSYSIPGTYNATLRIEDGSGARSLATTTITALPSPTPPKPPVAVLSSSTAAGNAPLPVTFDGASSTTPNPPIIKYNWKFGDGSEATGVKASHAYSTAGTYHAKLTVTDSLGLTDEVDTPIIVLGTVTPNEKPTAIITTDSTEGNAPLIVSFDGSLSSDPDGTIVSYDWNFGDGTTGTGQKVLHTYTNAAMYTMSLQVTDNLRETVTVTRQVICNLASEENILNIEVGEASIDHQWGKVLFENTFNQPIVIAGPPTADSSEPVLVRIRNIDQGGFEVRLQGWDYLDDNHVAEMFSYIVMEKGIYTLDSGVKIEAGAFTGSTAFQQVPLQQTYDATPVILSQIMTENDTDAVTGRLKKIKRNSFKYVMQEQESTKKLHGSPEIVGYIAWEPGKGEISGLKFETGVTGRKVNKKWFDLVFQTEFPDQPFFIADMQTFYGGDTAVLRTQGLSSTSTRVKVEEEQSRNKEVNHRKEVVGYLVIGTQ